MTLLALHAYLAHAERLLFIQMLGLRNFVRTAVFDLSKKVGGRRLASAEGRRKKIGTGPTCVFFLLKILADFSLQISRRT